MENVLYEYEKSKMIKFDNPFTNLINVVEKHYPKKCSCEIHFTSNSDKEKQEALGETFFPDDGGLPIIQIDALKTIPEMLDIFSHELAHVIAGKEAEHNQEFQDVYANIHKLYQEDFTKLH